MPPEGKQRKRRNAFLSPGVFKGGLQGRASSNPHSLSIWRLCICEGHSQLEFLVQEQNFNAHDGVRVNTGVLWISFPRGTLGKAIKKMIAYSSYGKRRLILSLAVINPSMDCAGPTLPTLELESCTGTVLAHMKALSSTPGDQKRSMAHHTVSVCKSCSVLCSLEPSVAVTVFSKGLLLSDTSMQTPAMQFLLKLRRVTSHCNWSILRIVPNEIKVNFKLGVSSLLSVCNPSYTDI
ncbi:hypothetical protein H920_01360 [Fukomys damarensis]|uniref:Uncharacterized protein n=1 Tax=Fukomys damarensis TaxID=885580 RepID=A0A091ENN6_FUKDA|nr:hypothetical protein H920_01360 [Fukomys damarensis]